jgi:hypothetical protein
VCDYNPSVFAAHYQTELGSALWRFLNEPETVVRMETATALDRPAVEAIEEHLLERFGEAVLDDRTKQMIGHMVRQVMERRGYIIAVQNTKITNGAPFSRATKYKRRDDMVFYAFRNATAPRTIALTADRLAERLLPVDYPKMGAKWLYWKSFRGQLRGRVAFGLNDYERARADITHQGYHIYEMPRLLLAAS